MRDCDLQRIRYLASEYMEMAISERQQKSIERFIYSYIFGDSMPIKLFVSGKKEN